MVLCVTFFLPFVLSDNSSEHEHKTRVLSAADEVDERSLIQQVTKPDPQEVSVG